MAVAHPTESATSATGAERLKTLSITKFNYIYTKQITMKEETLNNIYPALAAFQQECPTIHKGTQGYGYSYADLPTIFEVINPLLAKHNLGFTQLIEGQSIRTILFHTETGETLQSVTEIPQGVSLKGMNDYQVLGSAITYLRRYALSAMLGIVTDKDTDAGGEQKPKPKQKANFKEGGFEMALNAVADGKTTVAKIASAYNLTTEQLADLTEVEQSKAQ